MRAMKLVHLINIHLLCICTHSLHAALAYIFGTLPVLFSWTTIKICGKAARCAGQMDLGYIDLKRRPVSIQMHTFK